MNKRQFISYTTGFVTALNVLTCIPVKANEDSASQIPSVETVSTETDANGDSQTIDLQTNSSISSEETDSTISSTNIPSEDSLEEGKDSLISIQSNEGLEVSTTKNDIVFPAQVFNVDQTNKKVMFSFNVSEVTEDVFMNFTWTSTEDGPRMDTKTPVITINGLRLPENLQQVQSIDNTLSGDSTIYFPLNQLQTWLKSNQASQSDWNINIAYQAIPSNDPQNTQMSVEVEAYTQAADSSFSREGQEVLPSESTELSSFAPFEDDFTNTPASIEKEGDSRVDSEMEEYEQTERAGTSASPVTKKETIEVEVNQIISAQLNGDTYISKVEFNNFLPTEVQILIQATPDIFEKNKVTVSIDGEVLDESDFLITQTESSALNTYKIELSNSALTQLTPNSIVTATFNIENLNFSLLETSTQVDNGLYSTTYSYETGTTGTVAKPFSASHHYDSSKQTWTVSLVLNQVPASLVLTFTQQQGSTLKTPTSITLDGTAVSPTIKQDGTTFTVTFSASDVAKMKESSKIEVVFPINNATEVTEKVVMNVNDGNSNKDFSATFRVVKSSSTTSSTSSSNSTSSSTSSSKSSSSSSKSSSSSTVQTSTQTGTYALIGVLAAAAAAFVLFAVLSRKSQKSDRK